MGIVGKHILPCIVGINTEESEHFTNAKTSPIDVKPIYASPKLS